MKKDIGIWILLSICLIITIIILIISFMTTNIERKFNLIKESIIFNKQNVEDEDVKVVLMSFTNNIDKAKFFSGIGFSLEDAFLNVKKKADSFIEENNYDVKFLKADIVTDIKDTTYEEFEKELEDVQIAYSFRKGLILENTDGEIVFLTEAELNANNIIDYKNYQISLFHLNKYLDECNKNKFENLPNRFRTFSTISYFCDDKNNLYEIDSTLGYRKQEINKQEIRNMINLSSDYLCNLIDNHGKYIYGYYPQYDKQIAGYNILRHAGSTWSLIINADTMLERQKIESTLDYIVTTTKYLDNETGFVQEYLENEIKLGGNALSVIALCEYTERYDNRYMDILNALGNGILDMQKSDGSYIHILDASDFSIKSEYRTVFYDGEATLALAKLYSVTKDKRYLDAAEKALKYFIENDYTKHSDHWISYAVNEITKYVDNEEYYEFGLKNVANNIEYISNREVTSYTDLEMLMQCFELYERIKDRNIDVKYMDEFPFERLLKTIVDRAEFQSRSFVYPEIAMYLCNPEKYINSFYIREDEYRIRIDDIQHSDLGYYFYCKYYDKVNKYLEEL